MVKRGQREYALTIKGSVQYQCSTAGAKTALTTLSLLEARLLCNAKVAIKILKTSTLTLLHVLSAGQKMADMHSHSTSVFCYW